MNLQRHARITSASLGLCPSSVYFTPVSAYLSSAIRNTLPAGPRGLHMRRSSIFGSYVPFNHLVPVPYCILELRVQLALPPHALLPPLAAVNRCIDCLYQFSRALLPPARLVVCVKNRPIVADDFTAFILLRELIAEPVLEPEPVHCARKRGVDCEAYPVCKMEKFHMVLHEFLRRLFRLAKRRAEHHERAREDAGLVHELERLFRLLHVQCLAHALQIRLADALYAKRNHAAAGFLHLGKQLARIPHLM